MDRLLRNLLRLTAKALLKLRYRVEVVGLEKIGAEQSGLLLLPNHSAEIDPVLLLSFTPLKWHLRPLMVATFVELPIIGWLARQLRVISIPDFDKGGNAFSRKQAIKSLETVATALQQGD